ncbi:MAG TPA: S-methyl-5-thioribose-1-phosphate isomerase, partial [Gammaproteobacteria bacterium]|nr:S-methyl-5-thioribose-1-phosphate isomerase [Gammaproteobacteria bacterium]
MNSDLLYDSIRPIRWADDGLYLLDQRRLPAEEVELQLTTSADVAIAIKDMVVRGAPAIGITAAYGAVLALQSALQESPDDWQSSFAAQLSTLEAARPTAINLAWALARIRQSVALDNSADLVASALTCALNIHEQDINDNHLMGESGADLFSRWQTHQSARAVLTHCNAGALATGGYGTALGVVRSLYARDLIEQVYADETRPWLQGARLTAWELEQEGIPSCLLADSAAAALMQSGAIGAV